MKTIAIIVAAAMACFAAGPAHADTVSISVAQFVEHPALDAVLKGFQDDLDENGTQAVYQVHNAQANMATAQQIGSQIMGERPDLILTIATPTSQAVAQAMKKAPHMRTTPLLFTAVTDPIVAGLVKDLSRPGGNITGVSDLLPVDEHMAGVKRFLPNLKTLGVLYNAGEANSKITVERMTETGKRMGFTVVGATVSKR